MRHAHDMPFGARLLAGGGARCRLWAPAAKTAEVAWCREAGAVTELVPAQTLEGGWWECTLPLARAGELYQWRLDDGLAVPDPAARSNPQGPHAPSQLVDPHAFDWDGGWRGRPWHETVLYELHVGTFTPEGTFRAAAARLPALAALGVTAIELMPVAGFPGRFGWGYDGVLPFAPHAAYGTPDDLKHLVQEAHRLGLTMFLDVVYNHFGPDGNYLHAYAPAFFSQTAGSPWGAAINFDGEQSAPVREFFIHNALYWVEEFRFDGLRLDAVHAIVDTSRPHVLEQLSAAVRAACPDRHVHLVLENEHNHYHRLATEAQPGQFDGQWNDDFHHALHVALTGETHGYYHDYGTEPPLDLLGRALSHGMLFEGAPRKPGGARERVAATPPQPLTTLVNYAHNHDQVGNRARGERLSELVPAPAALLPTLLALLTPAIPMLFQGEECGAQEPFLYFADWEGELRDAVRAGRKREFAHAGDDLPDPCSEATFRASRPDCAQATGTRGRVWKEVVQSALAARARWITPRQPLLHHGRHTHQRVGTTGIAVQWRYTDGQMLALELNLGAEPLEVPLQHLGPVEAETVFSYRRPAEARAGVWPAWSVRWTLGAEITL
jgi:maltooligosyltrehalose trehalohydrolase